MLPTVSIPAHEPPQQRPRQALLRGGEGTLPLPGVRPQRQVARLLGPVAADVVPDPQGVARGGGVRHARQVEPDQGADPPKRGLGVRHEVLVAQAHRPPGAQPGAHPLRRQVQDRPTHGRLPHGASFVVPHMPAWTSFLRVFLRDVITPLPLRTRWTAYRSMPGTIERANVRTGDLAESTITGLPLAARMDS